eukprot:303169_1
MAVCESDQLWCFNLTSFTDNGKSRSRDPDHDLYVCLGASDIRIGKEIHIDRRHALYKGSQCQIYSQTKDTWYKGSIKDVSVDDEGEWLHVHYGMGFAKKEVRRQSAHLSVIMYDTWDDLLQYFRGDSDVDRIKESNASLLKRLTKSLDGYGVICDAELRFRIQTVLTYYKKSLNIIPDFDVFIKETRIMDRICNDNLHRFRTQYKNDINRKNIYRSLDALEDRLRHRSYDVGVFMRYEVHNPRFESLVEEAMFNEVMNITHQRLDEYLAMAKEIHSEKCFVMLSNADDFNFGIERSQPISISHILAIIIHTEQPNYAQEFTRSCLLLNHTCSKMVVQHHCNNFYWFGRLLFECIEYFGDTLEEQSSTLQCQGFPIAFKFDLFAPLINFPRST